jgi:small subunit ribosomal protein S20
MANHYSALKRARQTERREVINQANSSRVRSQIRAFRETLAGKDKKAAQASYRETVSVIDRAIQKGVLHSNTAARYKSRLAAQLNKLA